jgi:creatinine amidohydrolase
MQWEQLTSPDFAKAVEECGGVAIVPIGVIEPHSAHLPLGTDMLESHFAACRAAEREPAVVFPPYPFGVNHESAHLPGSVVIRLPLVLDLLENVCDEIARHGLDRIMLLSGHGGNRYLLPLFVQTIVEKKKPYLVYYHFAAPGRAEEAAKILETSETGHACERETSVGLHIHPHLVKMDQVPPKPFTSLERNSALKATGLYSPMDWYAMYPTMYVGDASRATAEKGARLEELRIEGIVRALKAIKADATTPALLEQFLKGTANPAAPPSWRGGVD